MRDSIINGLMFNITWLVIVTSESAVIAPCAALLHLLIHFAVMGKGTIELKVVFQVALIGVVVDQLLFYFQVFTVDGARRCHRCGCSACGRCSQPRLCMHFLHCRAATCSLPLWAVLAASPRSLRERV
ncbi:MAG: DUF2878 family protein [Haliea sp.]|nr:DUF2878 family protein [Haliea sp.]